QEKEALQPCLVTTCTGTDYCLDEKSAEQNDDVFAPPTATCVHNDNPNAELDLAIENMWNAEPSHTFLTDEEVAALPGTLSSPEHNKAYLYKISTEHYNGNTYYVDLLRWSDNGGTAVSLHDDKGKYMGMLSVKDAESIDQGPD